MDVMHDKITDLRFLFKFTGGDKSKMEKYINMFLTFIPAYTEKMAKFTEDKNWDAVSVSAGLLKAQMVYMAMKNQDNLNNNILMAKAKKPSAIKLKEELSGLKASFRSAIEELKIELAQLQLNPS